MQGGQQVAQSLLSSPLLQAWAQVFYSCLTALSVLDYLSICAHLASPLQAVVASPSVRPMWATLREQQLCLVRDHQGMRCTHPVSGAPLAGFGSHF